MKKVFVRTTVGLIKSHANFQSPKLVRVNYYRLENGLIELRSVSGHSLSDITKVPYVKITEEQYQDIPFDPYDESVEADAALYLLGWA